MKPKPPTPADFAALRHRAEGRLRERHPETDPGRTEADTQRLLHELQVHQVELEMQNEELQRAQEESDQLLMKFTDLYDFSPIGYFTLDRGETILGLNLAGASLLGIERTKLLNRRFGQLVAAGARPAFTAFLKKAFVGEAKEVCEVPLERAGEPPCHVCMEAVASRSGQECRVAVMDITGLKQAQAEQERLIAELQAALAQVKTLSGLLPICASCKKIRDDRGYWTQIESYIRSHSDAQFTHGICPECIRKLYPGLEPRPLPDSNAQHVHG